LHGLPYKTVAFHTLGCKLNFAETSTLAQDFINSGYSLVNFHNQNIGSERMLLIESYEDGFLSGLTENYIRVKTIGKSEEVNSIVPLQIKYIHGDEMIGRRI